jgi:hypothetical protein
LRGGEEEGCLMKRRFVERRMRGKRRDEKKMK